MTHDRLVTTSLRATVPHLGIDVDDVLSISEEFEL